MNNENNHEKFDHQHPLSSEEPKVHTQPEFESSVVSAPKSKSKLPLLIVGVLVVAVALFFALPAIKNSAIAKDPAKHVMYSFAKTQQEQSVSSTILMSARVDEKAENIESYFENFSTNPQSLIQYINALADNFKLRIDSNVIASEETIFSGDFQAKIQYQDKNFLTLIGSLKPWEIVMESPELYSKSMYFDINGMVQQEMAFDLNSLDILGYMNILREQDELYKKVIDHSKPYQDILYNFLKDHVEKLPGGSINLYPEEKNESITVYNYKLNLSDIGVSKISDLYIQLLEQAKQDANIKALILDRTDKIIDKAINDKDYEKFGATQEEFQSTTADLRKSLDEEFENSIDNAISDLRALSENTESQQMMPMPEMTLSIDKNHLLRQIRMMYALAVPDSPPILFSQIATYNAFGSDVTVAPSLPTDGVNLYELAYMPQPPADLIKEIGGNLTSKILSGEAMEALLKDAQDKKNLLPESERDAIANGLSEGVDQIKGSISFLLMFMSSDATPGTP